MGDYADGKPGSSRTGCMDAVTRRPDEDHLPTRYAKSYLDWLGEKRDWCISRQLWWGHRSPGVVRARSGYSDDYSETASQLHSRNWSIDAG